MEAFPKLLEAGEFELMCTEPRKRDLRIIPPGPKGQTVKDLISFIEQVKIFMRLIQ